MPKTSGIEGVPIKASPTLASDQAHHNNEEAKTGTNIINNIMHINSSGANINITSVPGSQNNFIFNQSAPINLNFYKNKPEAIDLSQKP